MTLGARVSTPSARAREHAFEALARTHTPALRAYALRICGDAATAGDIVQDTLERAMRSIDGLTPGTNERAWLFTILHNIFIDRCRKVRREPRTDSIEHVDVPAPEEASVPAWATISRAQLEGAVDLLDEEFRVVYRMHAFDELPYAEIAARLGVPANTVGTRLARARRKLRAILERIATEETP